MGGTPLFIHDKSCCIAPAAICTRRYENAQRKERSKERAESHGIALKVNGGSLSRDIGVVDEGGMLIAGGHVAMGALTMVGSVSELRVMLIARRSASNCEVHIISAPLTASHGTDPHLQCMPHRRARGFYTWSAMQEPSSVARMGLVSHLEDLRHHLGRRTAHLLAEVVEVLEIGLRTPGTLC